MAKFYGIGEFFLKGKPSKICLNFSGTMPEAQI